MELEKLKKQFEGKKVKITSWYRSSPGIVTEGTCCEVEVSPEDESSFIFDIEKMYGFGVSPSEHTEQFVSGPHKGSVGGTRKVELI